MIYCFTNITNGKKYIGCTNDINNRLAGHLWKASNPTSKFHKALKEHSILGFTVEVLEQGFVTEQEAIAREIALIGEHDSYENGYNSNRGGYGQPKGAIPWNKGKQGMHSQERLEALSKRRQGVPTIPKGTPNHKSADNARRGADKQRVNATGRRRHALDDGRWTWMYPRSSGTWYIKDRRTPNSKWREVDVTPPLN